MTEALNTAFDAAFAPFANRPPFLALCVFSVVTAVIVLVAYRFTSNQPAIRRVKDLLQAHLLEVRLFQDQLGVVWRAYGKLLAATLGYLGWSLVPLAVVAIPITLLIAQLDFRLGERPLQTGEAGLLVVRVDDPAALDRVTVTFPEGLEATAPPVRVPADRMLVARFKANAEGRAEVAVSDGGQSNTKEVVVGPGLERVSPVRLRGQWFTRLLESNEPPLPPTGAISSISLQYPERETSVGPWAVNWLVAYFVLTMVAGFALKPLFGAEF